MKIFTAIAMILALTASAEARGRRCCQPCQPQYYWYGNGNVTSYQQYSPPVSPMNSQTPSSGCPNGKCPLQYLPKSTLNVPSVKI